jgi:hypothetical protein
MSINTEKNILITSLLLETKKFLTVKELVVCCSLNKQNEKEILQISRYVRRIMSENISNLVEEKEKYVWLKLSTNIIYECGFVNDGTGNDVQDTQDYDIEPSEWRAKDYEFAAKHLDFMKSRKKLFPLLCLIKLYSVISKNAYTIDDRLIPNSEDIEEIIRFSRVSHPDIFAETQDMFPDNDEYFNMRIRRDNSNRETYDFLLITILANITLKMNGYNYLPIEFSESL